MRLVTYDRHGVRRLGAWVDGTVVDLPDAVGHPAFPATMEALVSNNGGTLLDAARHALGQPEALQECAVRRPRLLTPLIPSSLREFVAPSSDGGTGQAGSGRDDPDHGGTEPPVPLPLGAEPGEVVGAQVLVRTKARGHPAGSSASVFRNRFADRSLPSATCRMFLPSVI